MLLSFALPVYNDEVALTLTIASILNEVQDHLADVEILVSDNHSGDDAYAMSKSMLANYPNVQVVRQSANIGYAGNLMALASLSRGEYLWFIGAGDTVFPGCLAEIIRILKTEMPDFGTVEGRFNYHNYWDRPSPKIPVTFASKNLKSTVPLFNHAVSLNVMRRQIMLDLKQAHLEAQAGISNPRVDGSEMVQLVSSHDLYWAHLEAVIVSAEKRPDHDFKWFQYRKLSVLLNSNKNGNWDKGELALVIFADWYRVIRRGAPAFADSQWLKAMERDLRGGLLFRLLFDIRKEGTLSSNETVSQLKALPYGRLTKMIGAFISRLPLPVVSVLVYSRGRAISTLRALGARTLQVFDGPTSPGPKRDHLWVRAFGRKNHLS